MYRRTVEDYEEEGFYEEAPGNTALNELDVLPVKLEFAEELLVLFGDDVAAFAEADSVRVDCAKSEATGEILRFVANNTVRREHLLLREADLEVLASSAGVDLETPGPPPAVGEPDVEKREERELPNQWIWDDGLWKVRFQGSGWTKFPDTLGMRYLAVLLARPNQEISNVDLYWAGSGGRVVAHPGSSEILASEMPGAFEEESGTHRWDSEDRLPYEDRARIHDSVSNDKKERARQRATLIKARAELEAKKARARTPTEIKNCDDKELRIEAAERLLAPTHRRPVGTHAEKIAKAIARTRETLRKAKHGPLADHLHKYVRPGIQCLYIENKDVGTWNVVEADRPYKK